MTSIMFLIDTILSQRLQMQLSQKQKRLPQFCFGFRKSRLNCEQFRKKDDPHS